MSRENARLGHTLNIKIIPVGTLTLDTYVPAYLVPGT